MEPGGGAERIDALIERGLERYARGELLAALSEWEHALMLAPGEHRAIEYIAYVRENFELLEETFRQAKRDAEIAAAAEEAVQALEAGLARALEPTSLGRSAGLVGLDELAAGWTLDAPLPVEARMPAPDAGQRLDRIPATGGLPDAEPEIIIVSDEPEPSEPLLELTAEPAEETDDEATGARFGDSLGRADIYRILSLPGAADEETTGARPRPTRSQSRPFHRAGPRVDTETGDEGDDLPSLAEEKTRARARLPSPPSGRSTPALGANDSGSFESRPTQALARSAQRATLRLGERDAGLSSDRREPALDLDLSLDFTLPVTADPDEPRTVERASGWLGSRDAGPSDVELRGRIDLLMADAREALAADQLAVAYASVEAARAQADALDEVSGEGPPRGSAALAPHAATLLEVYRAMVGSLDRTPTLRMALTELGSRAIDHRVGFLLSRVDGTLTLEELIAVVGMPEEEIYQALARLLHDGVIALAE